MTWVKGTSTWGNIAQDLTRLICGEIADGSSTTVVSGDRWVREQTRTVTDAVLNGTTTMTSATAAFTNADIGSRVFGTGISGNTTISSVTNSTTVVLSATATSGTGVTVQICSDAIRTPSGIDVNTGSCSNRTGYFALISTVGTSSVARVTTPFTSDPSASGFHRWHVQLTVAVVNSVAGNYSTAVVSYSYTDVDSGAGLGSSSVTLNASGVGILPNGLQVTVSDPSGLLTVSTQWRRGFTSTYMYGIDSWPWYPRRSGNATFTVNPPGVAGTDYDIVEQAPATGPLTYDRSNSHVGLGIKTATGLGSNALYTLSFPMAYAKGRIFNSGTTGVLALDCGRVIVDTVNGNVMRVIGGVRNLKWAQHFQTPASVTTSSPVQYWMSVKPTGITVALYGDPGSSGKMGTAYFGDFTPYDTTYDVFPICFSGPAIDYTASNSGNSGSLVMDKGYFRNRRSLDGTEGTRDWQTKWMRSDIGVTDTYGMGYSSDLTTSNTAFNLAAVGFGSDVSFGNPYNPARQVKPSPVDNKWWLYGWQYTDDAFNLTVTNIDERRFIRGYQNTRFMYIPSDGWGNGDELTDTTSGTKYLLIVPDYAGCGTRLQSSSNVFWGGVAIAEL